MPDQWGQAFVSAPPRAGPIGTSPSYDVAISYAREDLRIARELATALENAGLAVFFDQHRLEEIWGNDLHRYLDDIYIRRSRFVLILASDHYGKRPWTIHEHNAARSRALLPGAESSILVISFGPGPIPGFPASLAHVELGLGLERIVDLVQKKVSMAALQDQTPYATSGKTVLATPSNVLPIRAPSASQAPVHGPVSMNETQAKTRNRTNNAGNYTFENIRGNVVTKNVNQKGLGSAGIVAILLVVLGAIGWVVWLAIDFVKHAPRNNDGSVTVLGVVDLPASLVGPREDEEANSQPPPPSAAQMPATTTFPGAPTREQLEGVWRCDQNATITFTEAGRVAITNDFGWQYPNTPFASWHDEPYAFVSERTMSVGGAEVNLELGTDEDSMRVIGGKQVFRCRKETF